VTSSTYVSVEVDADTAASVRRALGSGPDGGAADGPRRLWTLVDLTAEPPGWFALAGVREVDGDEPLLVELLVHRRAHGQGLERDLLDVVTLRMRAAGARRLRIGPGISLNL
jgi:GNAT superfamily N-acetyltransferase